MQKILADAGLPTKGLKKDLIATIIEKGIAPALPENYIHVYKLCINSEIRKNNTFLPA
ncbi:hypothetical protein [Acidaminococcus intestini]|uniref:hypothetical protein n=1 Tax=Acidaminococcus intestini TaxID=187327 RepID=UPI00345E62DC